MDAQELMEWRAWYLVRAEAAGEVEKPKKIVSSPGELQGWFKNNS